MITIKVKEIIYSINIFGRLKKKNLFSYWNHIMHQTKFQRELNIKAEFIKDQKTILINICDSFDGEGNSNKKRC